MRNKIQVIQGDITTMEVDVIVNAANTSLLGGGGVDGAIHRAAGPELLEECKRLGGCPTGQARITKAYNLPAKHIIHTVGPIWHGGAKGEPHLLASCYASTFELFQAANLKTIALPAISCGAYGYPLLKASAIAMKETANFLELYDTIEAIYFVCFNEPTYQAYLEALTILEHD